MKYCEAIAINNNIDKEVRQFQDKYLVPCYPPHPYPRPLPPHTTCDHTSSYIPQRDVWRSL